jgi:hypothetical protein
MSKKKYGSTISSSINNIFTDILNGKYAINYSSNNESNLFGDGVSMFLGENKVTASSPNERKIVNLAPQASILVKKKAFSSFKDTNDLQWLDRTEKMLLRATKALFALKVAQIRAYESLTKVENYFQQSSEVNLSLFASLLDNAKHLVLPSESNLNSSLFNQVVNLFSENLSNLGYDDLKQDVLLLLERNSFAGNLQLTTWIVDPNNIDNYETGPGTGVIEIGMYSGFNTETNLNTEPTGASFSLEDPYQVMNVNEEDIELSIEEALVGTIGLLSSLSDPEAPPIDARSVLGAGLELLGLGNLDPDIDVNYIRNRLRLFYLGKPFVSSGDGVHFYIRGNKTVQDFSKENNILDKDFFSLDETIFEAERILFTNGNIDLETYKNIRQFSDNSFGMRHVYGGYITNISESWSNGRWVLKASCTNNMGWLTWSRFMMTPALQDPQGILEDPLTPYEIKVDATGSVLSASGPQLLEENKYLIKNGLLFYDSGILNGQIATENNLLQGQYNKGGSLSGTKVLQHPHGLVYRWKEGIITATAGVNIIDPYHEHEVSQALHNQVYGLSVAQDVLNNLDIANILSILIVGQPYNIETFVNQAYQAHNISQNNGSLNSSDPLAAVLDVVKRQNNHFGNFRPYRMITMSSQTLLQTANSNILRNGLNEKVRQLQQRRAQLDALIRRLQSSNNAGGILLNSLIEERRSIESGISEQINILMSSGTVSSSDIITQNFNLFGKSKTLPLTGNYTADHQITRAMTLVGAQRRIEDVRLNRDQNLFIVSDQYDEQTDIRPFIFKIKDADYKIFKGNFISVYDKCSEAAKFINLEFFCNSQGHLEFRPPQWNKTPLTVLERLFQISQDTNKSIIPEFLTQIFQSRTSSLRMEIHSLNLRIVLLSLLLNKYPDRTLIPNFNPSVSNNILLAGSASGKASLKFFGVNEVGASGQLDLLDGKFQFSIGNIIDTGSQVLGNGLNLEAGLGKNGDILNGDTTTLLGSFDPIFQESVGLTNDLLTVATQPSSVNPIKIANASNLNLLRENFVKISGIDPASDLVTNGGKFQTSDFIFNNNSTSSSSETDNITKANNYLQKLQKTISDRDNLVTILQRNQEKQDELEQVEEILSGEFTAIKEAKATGLLSGVINSTNKIIDVLDRASSTVKTITDIFTGDVNQGTLFDHLIEDDTKNLLGPGSGKRYIIYDEDIISCTYTEQPPDFCRIDVVGDAPIVGDSLQSAYQERYFWAGATDFDLWRQYGYKHGGNRSLPFASDSELQAKPYAILELQLQRVKINQGNVVIVGNEYYEPGDVVYIPSKGLLYYVRGVQHDYEIGQIFTTTLNLEFGHPPGNYLPSPLDVIGQQFTKDPMAGNILVYRNQKGDDNYQTLQPDSSLVFPQNVEITDENISVLLDYKDNAVRFTNMMADLSSLLIGNRIVLIRGFVRGRSDPDEEIVRNNLNIVKKLLQEPVTLTQTKPTSIIDDILDTSAGVRRGIGVDVGTTKGVVPMILPNGLPIVSIPNDKLAEQIVYMEDNGSTSEIQFLNPSLLNAQVLDSKLVGLGDYEAIFPKGGPKQRSWLDIKSENKLISSISFKVSNIIEIGILDISNAVDVGIQKQNDISIGFK